MTESENRQSSRRTRAFTSSSIVVAFFLFSQLVVVPLVGGTTISSHAIPATIGAIMLFGATYLVSVKLSGRLHRRRD
ncbi:hypothetical protein B5P19_00670 [Clavibacter sepedonicus]|nr:hypothetical protein B5P19_00670 [Clavibacter sepedonicus]OQJ55561.1 hypothetical protein B5P20_14355 [Clavibacter sepedonicus]